MRLDVAGPVAVITIDNPPVNALHPTVAEGISSCLARLGGDPEVRCIVVVGTGRHFVAGGDLTFVRTLDRRRAERYVLRIQEVQDELQRIPQPVIAAVNGTALGGGCELAMACDIRIAEEGAIWGQPEVSLGIIPGAGGTQNLPRLVPLGRAKRLIFSAERISAQQALSIGLVDEVVSRGGALEAAVELAHQIARNAPLAVKAAKRAINLGMQMGAVDAHRLEATLFAPLVETSDFAEGASAFLEKRPPNFIGR